MKNLKTILPILAAVFCLGCGNTAEGVKQDTEINREKAAEQTQDIGKAADEAGKDLGAASMLTPKVKLAISADSRLNDAKNLINVDSTNERVMLEGHVTSQALKTLAGEITAKVLKDNNAHQPVENKLEIKP